ncbi:MAG: FAD-dependent oxidoreductase [Ignavibacteriae bacterium]|nr:FAD-dependent oxidoreductase [Ignavibacteriota bacterium]
MTKIIRDINSAKNKNYDMIIIGGGFYGVMLAYESACRGLKTLLLEKNDFGSATSFNSLRIVHGGLRYLQSLDLHRFKESVGERKWFLKNFPNLTKPISCLMPLYNKGLQRNSIMWAALNLNDILSINRNNEVGEKNSLLNGKIISSKKVKDIFPMVDTKELKGGAVWNDGAMDDSQLVILEILKTAVDNGCTALNYFEVKSIVKEDNKVKGVIAVDEKSNSEVEFNSSIIINSTGPWSRELAKSFHKDFEDLFKYSIAWNILFDVDALSESALAITPPKDNAKAYFLRPWKGKLFAGTTHQTWDGVETNPIPTEESINNFIEDLNLSIPNLNLTKDKILQIYSGLLPAKKQGSNEIAVREIILNHAEQGGPQGLYSLSGVKLTTSRLVAEKVLNKIFENKNIGKRKSIKFSSKSNKEYGVFEWDWNLEDKEVREIIKSKFENESVVHLQDLLLRRSTLGDNPINALKYAEEICNILGWDKEKTENEIEDLKNYYTKRGLVISEKEGVLV